MSHVAESYVYENMDGGKGYVGRAPRGNFRKVANPGAMLSDEQVENLGLADLKDHTDYKAILKKAKADGAPVTVRGDDGAIHSESEDK